MIPLAGPLAERYLQPGEVFFGGGEARVRTVLGSCVSITLWHPQRRLGGMCHYMLPERTGQAGAQLDGRYAPEAFELLLRRMRAVNTKPAEYHVKLFGGGRMFAGESRPQLVDIGRRNVAVGMSMLGAQGLQISSVHLCGDGHRCLIFDLASGDVWVKHLPQIALLPGAERCAPWAAQPPTAIAGHDL